MRDHKSREQTPHDLVADVHAIPVSQSPGPSDLPQAAQAPVLPPAVDVAEPFRTKLKPRWLPAGMVVPPLLDPAAPPAAIERLSALLINPFYPKDPHASFGKHVLTPSLALTSFAGATPPGWRLQY